MRIEAKACWTPLARTAWDRALACLSGLPQSALFMTFHQARFGGLAEVPREITDPFCGLRASAEPHWGKKHSRTLGGNILFILLKMSSDDLDGLREGSGVWNTYLLGVKCIIY